MKASFLIFVLSFLFYVDVSAQEKYERETRIEASKVPTKAIDFVKKITSKEKIRWYLEENLEKKSLEAKFKLLKQNYSVEFDLEGNMEDVEIEIKQNQVPEKTQAKIKSYLSNHCNRFKVKKIQSQYLGKKIIALLQDENSLNKKPSNYELVLKCKKEKNEYLYEFLFDAKGNFVSKSKIIFKNAINLEY